MGADKKAAGAGGAGVEKRRKRGLLKTLVVLVCVLLGVGVLLLAIAPTAIGVVGKGIASGAASGSIKGEVRVTGMSLSWFGSQRLEGTLVDPDGGDVGTVEVDVSRGLIGFLGGSLDVGTVTVRGDAEVVRAADGSLNLLRAVEGVDGSGGGGGSGSGGGTVEPLRLPASLAGVVKLDGLNVVYRDASLGDGVDTVKVDGLDGELVFGAGAPVTLSVSAPVLAGRGDATDAAGRLEIDATLTDAVGADGVVNMETSGVEGTLEVTGLSSAVADALAAMGGRLREAISETSSLRVSLGGTLGMPSAVVALDAGSVKVDGGFAADLVGASDGKTVRSTDPLVVRLDTGPLSRLLEDREALVGADADAAVTSFPVLTLTVSDLTAPIPGEGGLDLRSAGAVARLEMSELAAGLRAPGLDGRRRVVLRSMDVVVDAARLGESVRVLTSASPTIDGATAGVFAVDMTVAGLLDDAGAFAVERLPRIEGTVEASRLAMSVVQPLVAGLGVDLEEAVGRTLNLRLAATPVGEGATDLDLSIGATELTALGGLRLDGSVIETTGEGFELTASGLGAALSGLLGDGAVAIRDAEALVVRVPRLSADLAAVSAGDLRSVSAEGEVSLASVRGTVAGVDAAGDPSVSPFVFSGFRVGVDARDLTAAVRVEASGNASVDGRDAGSLDVGLVAGGLLDGAGGLSATPRLNGRAALVGVSAAAADVFLAPTGLRAARDLGRDLMVELVASRASETETNLDLRFGAEHASAQGTLVVGSEMIRLADTGLVARHSRPGPTLTALAGGEAMSFDAEAIEVRVTSFSLPIDAGTGGARTADAAGAVSLSVPGLTVTNAAGPSASVRALSVGASLERGAQAVVSVDGRVRSGDETGRVRGSVTLGGLLERAGGALSVNAGALSPVGTVTFEGLPTASAAVAVPRIGGGEGVAGFDTAAVLRDVIGPALGLTVAFSESAGGGVAVEVDGSSEALTLSGDVGVARSVFTGGGFGLDALGLETRLAVSQRSFARIAQVAGLAEGGATPRLVEATSVSVGLGLNEGGTAYALTVESPGAVVSGLTLPGGEGEPARDLGVVTLALDGSGSLPVAALTDTERAHEAGLRFGASLVSRDAGPIGEVSVDASAPLMALQPAGEVSADVRLVGVRTAWLDPFAGEPVNGVGMVSGLLGDTVGATLDATVVLPETVVEGGAAYESADVTVSFNAPNMRTAEAARVTATPVGVRVVSPLDVSVTAPAAWVSRFLVDADGKAMAEATAPVNVNLRAEAGSFPLAAGGPPLNFDVGLTADRARVEVTDLDGNVVPVEYRDMAFTARSVEGDAVAFVVRADGAGGRAVDLPDGRVTGLIGADGGLSPESAAVTGTLSVKGVPSSLIDALGGLEGLAAGMFGPAIGLDLRMDGLSAKRGSFEIAAGSPLTNVSRTAFDIRTNSDDQTRLVMTSERMDATVRQFDRRVGVKLTQFLPLFGSLSKDAERHRATTVRATQFVWPLSGYEGEAMERIKRMQARIDPGELGYELRADAIGALQGVIANALNESGELSGRAGTSMGPFDVQMKGGVLTYSGLVIPIGEFELTADGEQNFLNGRQEHTVGLPVAELIQEGAGNNAGGAISGLLGSVVDAALVMKGRSQEQLKWGLELQEGEPDPGKLIDGILDLAPGGGGNERRRRNRDRQD